MKRTIVTVLFAIVALQCATTSQQQHPTPHVARVWHGQVPASRGDEYEKYLYENGILKLRAIPGNLGAQMFRRTVGDREDFIVISYWPSEDAIRAYAGANVTKTHLLPRDPEFLIDPEMEVKHYKIAADEKP